VAGLVLLAPAAGGVAPLLASGATSVAPAVAAPTWAALPPAMTPDQLAAGHGCAVSGDLVFSSEGTTGGNPAVLARALCGH
jgi:hypothetical protein